jgi:16S rRNA (guanine527-N7)-methyltransferase
MMELLVAGAAKLGISLSASQCQQFEIYYHELVSWNERVNLTAITSYEEVQLKHFLDSLTIAAVKDISLPLTILDVGTGAGFPGIPLKLVFPNLRLTLLEATAKKTAFLQHILITLNLNDVTVLNGRAEDISHQPQYRESFDLVLSRAVALLPSLVELTLPFCKIPGRFIALKKGDISLETTQAQKAIGIMGGELKEIKLIELNEFADQRSLVIIDKIKPSPPRYPRRSGMPEKRPILS